MSTTSLKALLVDDDAAQALIMREAAAEQASGLNVAAVRDGETAMAYLRRCDPPDVVFLDLDMPGRDGFWVLRSIRSETRCRLIPVIVLSGNTEEASIARAYACGANLFVAKPTSFERYLELLKLVCRLWAQSPSRALELVPA